MEFFECAVDERLLDEIKKASNLVVTSVKTRKLDGEKLKAMFENVKDNSERNKQIVQAHNEGYSQYTIAACLRLSQPYVNRIIKKERGIGIT